MGANKGFMLKKRLGKKMKQNRAVPHWFRMKSDTDIRYNVKKRHWLRTKLGISEFKRLAYV
ncbi:Ribosomal L39 protein family protein [Cryptosporidium meleagridis]|uniref:Ribosomal L39 protein family protein n=1 Tax=Cryptosporidium meleagridis TaxID=93969 RepID=A0A2P4Z119_9CRYT|nr:Ribosomal L39 protein family protein [Cryptosporidium meleagridis]